VRNHTWRAIAAGVIAGTTLTLLVIMPPVRDTIAAMDTVVVAISALVTLWRDRRESRHAGSVPSRGEQ
jgi:hypothetical protein